MKFSIVTPNYNYGRFLKKALESVLAQADAPGAPAVEHIVVDGGSTDDSVSILKDWAAFAAAQPAAKDGRYSFSYVSEPDNGQTDAINKGLRRATGDVVAWLNADEWYEPGALSKMASAFEKRPKADLIHGEVRFVRPDGSAIRVKRDHRFSGFVLLWCGCYISSAATFWRRRVLDDGDYLDASYKVCMDFEYWVRLWRHGYRFSFLPETLASFTWHENNVSEVFAARRREERNKVQALYAPRLFRTGSGRARFAGFFAFFAHQIRRMLVLERL
ncbi:MAG: glycosyltransferase, partial [Kiritimatiellae bacterium]|nr:glycosyltransferase [Kiritimatiellia bacterium]